MTDRRARFAIAIAAIVLGGGPLAGCYRRFDIVDRLDRDGSPPRLDAGVLPIDASRSPPPDGGFVEPSGACAEPAAVDLLLVVDDSASMAEGQALLLEALPALVRGLVAPPDDDLDGAPDWLPVPSLHVGVVTPNMGSGGYPVPTCEGGAFGARFGDDGILRTLGDTTRAGCDPTFPAPLVFMAGDDVSSFSRGVACVASVGTGGCGFEQPLEAMLKALAPVGSTAYTGPDYRPPIFFDSTYGHGDRENAGFLRDDSLLAVIVLTDEDDCSVSDPGIFDVSSPTYTGDLGLRCFLHPEAQHPIERYVEGLVALRAGRPDLLALAVIAGVPPELATALPTRADYEAILRDPDMIERLDPGMPTRLVPSCTMAGSGGAAYPPVRLVRTAMSLGAGRGTVQSICQGDLAPALAPITRLLGRRACKARLVL